MRKFLTFSVVFAILGIGAIIANGRPFSSTLGAPVVLISEEDGDPISRLRLLLVPDDSLTDNGGGTLSLDTSSGDADEVAVAASTTALQALIDLNITALAQVGIDTDTLKGLIDNNATELVAVGVSTQALQDAIDAINFDSVFEAVGLSTQTNADNILTNAVDISTVNAAKVNRAGDTMTGQLTLDGSTLTVTGNAFSVGTSTLVVKEGLVGIRTDSPATALDVSGTITATGLDCTDCVNTADIADATVTSDKIADGSITTAKFADICAADQVIARNAGDTAWECSSVAAGGVALGDSPTWTGNHTWNNVLLIPNGTISAPAIAFASDLNTGIYTTIANKIDFTADGIQSLQISKGQILLPDGTNSLPSISFVGDADTGIRGLRSNRLSFITGTVERMRIDASGNLGIGETDPEARLEVKAAESDQFIVQISSQGGSSVWNVDRLGLVEPPSFTIAELKLIAPRVLGQTAYCSDCTLAGGRMVESTGTAPGEWADADGSDWN